jgi:hypothetical protein
MLLVVRQEGRPPGEFLIASAAVRVVEIIALGAGEAFRASRYRVAYCVKT